jgi:hypothetical protein
MDFLKERTEPIGAQEFAMKGLISFTTLIVCPREPRCGMDEFLCHAFQRQDIHATV